jgi:sulfur-oxidizing protein SoxY
MTAMRKDFTLPEKPAPAEPAPAASFSRRDLLVGAAGLGATMLLRRVARAQAVGIPDDLAAAISMFTGGQPALPGRVVLDIASIVDNGNSVPVTVTVSSPMTPADHVTAIALFNERNPQRDVGVFQLGPLAGRAKVSTRIRLATSQRLVAVARISDGTCWSHSVEVIVALAACIE